MVGTSDCVPSAVPQARQKQGNARGGQRKPKGAGFFSVNTFTKARLDYNDGVQEYDIEFVSGGIKYEYEIKAADVTILQFSQEAVEQLLPSNAANSASDGAIGLDEAKSAALAHAGFSADQITFTKAKLDYDDGVMEYEIEFVADGKEYEFTIDAATGTITEYDVENGGRR